MAKVSLITLTWNRPVMMRGLIESVATMCDVKDIEWILVDNDTIKTDLYERVFKFYDISAKVIRHNNTGSFGSMCNSAATMATGEYLHFLNNDVIATSDFIAEQLKCFDDAKCVASGAVLKYPDGSLQHAGVIFADEIQACNLGERAIDILKLDRSKVDPDNWGSHKSFHAVTGASLMMRAADFNKIAGFHEEFKYALEDVDLCIRACSYLKGYCLINPKATLIHDESSSGGDRQVDSNFEIFHSRWLDLHPNDWRRFLK